MKTVVEKHVDFFMLWRVQGIPIGVFERSVVVMCHLPLQKNRSFSISIILRMRHYIKYGIVFDPVFQRKSGGRLGRRADGCQKGTLWYRYSFFSFQDSRKLMFCWSIWHISEICIILRFWIFIWKTLVIILQNVAFTCRVHYISE